MTNELYTFNFPSRYTSGFFIEKTTAVKYAVKNNLRRIYDPE